jgi:hypothetical protein
MSAHSETAREMHAQFKAWFDVMPKLPSPEPIKDDEWGDICACLTSIAITTRTLADKFAALALDTMMLDALSNVGRKLWAEEWEKRLK